MAVVGSDEKVQLERFLRDKVVAELVEIKRSVTVLNILLIHLLHIIIFRMLIETFGPYFHQGMVTNAHRLCGGCGWNRSGHLRALRGPEPVHICTLPSADAYKYRRWELSMKLMRDDGTVNDLMDQLIEKVCTICLSIMYTISYAYLLFTAAGARESKGVETWLNPLADGGKRGPLDGR